MATPYDRGARIGQQAPARVQKQAPARVRPDSAQQTSTEIEPESRGLAFGVALGAVALALILAR